MRLRQCEILWVVTGFVLAGCAQPTPTAAPAPASTAIPIASPTPEPTADDYFRSDGGGEPRSAGYWLVWNSCAPDNRAEMARANGGRAAGWVLVDDILADPGINLGGLKIKTCAQAVELLQSNSVSGVTHADDPVFNLASQLLTAYMNLESGAESCLGVVDGVLGAHALLAKLSFDGEHSGMDTQGEADLYILALQQYNTGQLCR